LAVEFDAAAAEANIQRVRPGMQTMTVSTKSGAGISEWLDFLTATADRRNDVLRSRSSPVSP
jgi:Ni2+-binding GTPase involved in maturation of urease and hydrogenase